MIKDFLMIVAIFILYAYLTVVRRDIHLAEETRFIWDFKQHKDIHTEDGIFRGSVASDGQYYAFLGIPYADTPSGSHRFQAPLRTSPHNGINYVNRIVKCPQRNEGDLDCLILNIFTPEIDATLLAPVLIYIHGGSFQIGVGPTKGFYPLMRENIIVVTVNYRLGPFGFLCLGINEAPGNVGLKDQLAALKWVKKNIRNFGGDPSRITVYGMSAGAASVEYHILANSSRGLFQRAILESGTANAVFALDPTPILTAIELSKLMNFPEAKSVDGLAKHYMKASVESLSQVSYDFYYNMTDGLFGEVPCVENSERKDAYLKEAPYNILSNANYDKIPLMVFYASLEGLFLNSEKFYEANYPERMDANFNNFIPADLAFDNDLIKEDVAIMIKNYYFKRGNIKQMAAMEFLNYFGDTLVLRALLASVRFHSKCDNPVYFMEFAYKGKMGTFEKFYENIELAGHGDVIKHAILMRPLLNDMDKLTVERVARIIGNFVKYGNPVPEPTTLLPVTWPVVRPGNMRYLRLSKEFQILENPHQEMMVFWDNLYNKYRRPVKPVDSRKFPL